MIEMGRPERCWSRVVRGGAFWNDPRNLRYMDDLMLLHDERTRLEEARAAIREWLDQERGLMLNPKRWHVVPAREPVVFLGYRVSPAGIGPSRKLRRRMAGRLRHAARRGPDALARTLAAYRGLLLF